MTLSISGIDYSMSSPSVCVHKGSSWSIENCSFYYIVKKDKHLIRTNAINGTLYPDWIVPEERFSKLANWSLDILKKNNVSFVSLEGYAYGAGSKGLVFQIGENTGVLKQKLWETQIDFEVTPPTVIKKFATGKGNSNKEAMWNSFIAETDLNLFHLLGQEEKKNWNPVSDMVDAYYLAKYKFSSLSQTG